jgi:predicted DsbA family dithiol-disulfide isomerase
VKVDIWSDIVCPFCYIGKRQLENALDAFPDRESVEVIWRSFQLNPDAEVENEFDIHDFLARKYGMTREEAQARNAQLTERALELGLDFEMDRVQPSNSFDGHRLVHFASVHGLQDQAEERLFAAYFTEGKNIGLKSTLVEIGRELGLDGAAVVAVLSGTRFQDDVREDQALAQSFGVTGVPFFVFDRTYAVSGAQGSDLLLEVMNRVFAESKPLFGPESQTPGGQG